MVMPDGTAACVVGERSRPGGIIVDDNGQRFANEAQNYNDFGLEMLDHGIDKGWLIIDMEHRKRYMFGDLAPGKLPQHLIDSGFFRLADSIPALALQIGVNPDVLEASVERFNAFARAGKDEDFRRGETYYEQYWGDPKIKPNPCLRQLTHSPFIAVRLYLGDLGTRGGLLTDQFARALDGDGQPVEGMYAAGNCTASVMGSSGYPGPGSTLGPAMTFGYIAGRHAAARQ